MTSTRPATAIAPRAAADDDAEAGEARAEQYRRFLGQVRGTAIVRALAEGRATAQEVLARLGPAAGRKDQRTLERLEALGLVEFDPSQRTYELAKFLVPLVPRA